MIKKICLGLSLFVIVIAARADEVLVVQDAWIPEAPPVAMMNAGYLVIKNNGKQPIDIVGAQSDAYGDVEIHKSITTKDGMARMIKQDKITVAPGKEVKFERGGLHLMLMQPKHALKVGDTVKMELITKDQQHVAFTAMVKAPTLGEHDHSHHHSQ